MFSVYLRWLRRAGAGFLLPEGGLSDLSFEG